MEEDSTGGCVTCGPGAAGLNTDLGGCMGKFARSTPVTLTQFKAALAALLMERKGNAWGRDVCELSPQIKGPLE